ncbi:hypothetical protein [uncultured Clostridium sp.]|uniref:hypothetical protein n=1 Tax=uncultured Clostridium sp. TaxID=59620 RepID=UPI00261D9B79|nr:hypothetical protein [uncultured Clostridium sp.]
MNKRQSKKNIRKVKERLEFFFNNTNYTPSRQCGKTALFTEVINIITDKSYVKFKKIRKIYIKKK